MTMKTTVNVTCDGVDCNHVRAGDANHWLVGCCYNKTIGVGTTRDIFKFKDGFDISVDPPDNAIKDFCGEECAIKWVSKMLTEIKTVEVPKNDQ